MGIRKIHHVAYRCRNAKQTVEWYGKYLKMGFIAAIAEDQVPSTKDPDPYMHIFLDAGGGNVLAFFELPNSPTMGRDTNTPDWVQHIAFRDLTRLGHRAVSAQTPPRLSGDGAGDLGLAQVLGKLGVRGRHKRHTALFLGIDGQKELLHGRALSLAGALLPHAGGSFFTNSLTSWMLTHGKRTLCGFAPSLMSSLSIDLCVAEAGKA